jgi:hypothetical protein
MSTSDANDAVAICPQCRTGMVHVAVTPHPVVRNMQRNTFVCYSCKRTRTYMLPGKPGMSVRDNNEVAPAIASYRAN